MARGGRAPGVSIVEAFGRDVKPRELEDVLRLEYRSKLLNPRWARAMAVQVGRWLWFGFDCACSAIDTYCVTVKIHVSVGLSSRAECRCFACPRTEDARECSRA